MACARKRVRQNGQNAANNYGQRTELEQELNRLTVIYLPEYPEVRRTKKELEGVRNMIRTEVKNLVEITGVE